MFCKDCGAPVDGRFCAKCGAQVKSNTQVANGVIEFKQTRNVYTTAPGAPNSGLAIAALVITFFVPFIGVILGIVARNEIKNSQGQKSGDNLANLAILLGILFMFLYLIYFIFIFNLFGSY